MWLRKTIQRRLAKSAPILTFTVLAISIVLPSTAPAVAADISLQDWDRLLRSAKLQDIAFSYEVTSWDSVGSEPNPSDPPTARHVYEVVRRDKWFRIKKISTALESSDEKGTRRMFEYCYTDQDLHIQTHSPVPIGKSIGTEHLKAGGQMSMSDIKLMQVPSLLFDTIVVFGFFFYPDEPLQLITDLPNAQVGAFSERPVGDFFIELGSSSPRLPVRFEHRYQSWAYEQGKYDTSRRVPEGKGSHVIEDIRWDDDLESFPIPKSFAVKSHHFEHDFARHSSARLLSVTPSAGLSDSDFLPDTELPEGFPVTVNDFPVECEWRNGKVQPVVTADLLAPPSAKFITTIRDRWAGILITGGCIAILIAIVVTLRANRVSS